MWVMTKHGFVSAVEDWDDPTLFRVRARDKKSLQNMLDMLKENGENINGLKIVTGQGTDYRHRVVLPRDLFCTYLIAESNEVDYPNFKDSVTASRGKRFHDALMQVWVAMLAVDDGPRRKGYQSWDLSGRQNRRVGDSFRSA